MTARFCSPVGPCLALCLAGAAGIACGGEVTGALERAMARRGAVADTAVIVRFAGGLDRDALAVADRRARDNRLLRALRAQSDRLRPAMAAALKPLGAQRTRYLWLIHGLATTVPANKVRALAQLPGVASVDLDGFVQGGRSQRTPAAPDPLTLADTAPPATVQAPAALDIGRARPAWNITAIKAPALWAQGHTGQGVVVATLDTGVDLDHPDLRGRWRGGTNSWFDPHGETPSPHDALGHGTQSMGVLLGGPDLGVAPDARWIAARLYDHQGRASMSDIHRAFEWLLDPDGDPATLDAPDVVSASWALTGRATGACVMEFSEDIQALRSAGIAVVFAAGNDGPAPGTSNSPGNNPGVLSVGATDREGGVARQSSRGPSACDGGVFPRLLAPGVDVRTADLSHGGQASYVATSGSSVAAPHAAGVLALLAGAFPAASVSELEAALLDGARAQDPDHPGAAAGALDAPGAFAQLQRLGQASAAVRAPPSPAH